MFNLQNDLHKYDFERKASPELRAIAVLVFEYAAQKLERHLNNYACVAISDACYDLEGTISDARLHRWEVRKQIQSYYARLYKPTGLKDEDVWFHSGKVARRDSLIKRFRSPSASNLCSIAQLDSSVVNDERSCSFSFCHLLRNNGSFSFNFSHLHHNRQAAC